MRLTVGDSTLRTFQNCSPSRARLGNDLLDSATKNSDRLSNLGCSRTISDIIVEPQRPVLTMKTGGSMQIPRRSSRRTRQFGIQFRGDWYSPIGESYYVCRLSPYRATPSRLRVWQIWRST